MQHLFDTHAHLPSPGQAPDCAEYVARAEKANVQEILLCSTHPKDFNHYQSFVCRGEHLYYTVGTHPLDIQASEDYHDDIFLPHVEHPRMIAIGEIGLDYYYESETRLRQLDVFEQMLSLSLKSRKPAVIHLRDKMDCDLAYADAFPLLKRFREQGGQFVLHSYAGDTSWLQRFKALDCYFGVNGMVTFKKSDNIRNAVALMPQNKILLETDSPYLAPVPFRGQENHPEHVAQVAIFVASMLGLTVDEITVLTTANAHTFFRIP